VLKYAVLNILDLLADFISLHEVQTESSYGGRGAHDQPLAGGPEFEVTPLHREHGR